MGVFGFTVGLAGLYVSDRWENELRENQALEEDQRSVSISFCLSLIFYFLFYFLFYF